MKSFSLLFSFLLFATVPAGLAAQLPPPPKVVSDLTAHPWPQSLVGECDASAKPLTLGATQVTSLPDGTVVAYGEDRNGNPWKFAFDTAPLAECQLWRFNLSDSGSQALVFLAYGTDSSGGAHTTLHFLFFDHSDRPIPWHAVGRFTANDDGIEQLIAADSPTHPQLIVPHEEGRCCDMDRAYHLLDLSPEGLHPAASPAHQATWPILISSSKEYIAQEKSYKPSLAFAAPSANSNLRLKGISRDAYNNLELIFSDGSRHPVPGAVLAELPDGSRTLQIAPEENYLRGLAEGHLHVSLSGEMPGSDDTENQLLWVSYTGQ